MTAKMTMSIGEEKKMLKQRNYNEMVTYILDKIKEMDISKDDKKTLFAYITSLESKYFMEMGNAQRWIPCSQRLPEEGLYVVTNKWHHIDFLYYQRGRGWYHGNQQDIEGKPTVIAWMPLPEPYKEGSDD